MNNKGGVPPIVTALIVLVFIAATAVVGWFILSVTGAATKQGIPSIRGPVYAYDDGSSTTIYITIKNIGTNPLDLSNAQVVIRGVYSTGTCNPTSIGHEETAHCTFSGLPTGLKEGEKGLLQVGDSQVVFAITLP